ncbi:hypothetical protein DE146DRAFT_671416 [Phaeosphaeria sp. MPI-PUGE-AT-0046c]|nr:hypothetical protein DE146DRAFT_671416 [Phaeosphaeria sp. MPI-PUGE-AT-0046c]
MSFEGKVIAITGAASGIGLATAHHLASLNATLCLADLNSSALEAACTQIKEKHPSTTISLFPLDVRSESQVSAWISSIISSHSRLDGAANLAGVIGPSIGIKGLADLDVSEWDFVLDVNLKGVMLCLKYQVRAMTANPAPGGGNMSIVNASSIAGVQGMPFNASYTASKHAVIGLTRAVAKEVGKQGIRVNAICPGYIDTPMNVQSKEIQQKAGVVDEEKRRERIESVALGRGGRAEEVASLISYLLGEGSSFVTGNACSIDGGWNC